MSLVDRASGVSLLPKADSGARVTAQDFPNVLEHTKGYIQRHKVEGRFDFLPGDLKQVNFGENRFDVALLGNIVHSEGELSLRHLLSRASSCTDARR